MTATANFNQLMKESYSGNFTFEPTDKIEISVSSSDASITVNTFRSTKHLHQPLKTEYFPCLYGSLGNPSLEEKFNEIIKSL